MNLWGSWCPPCLRELRELANHYSDLQSKGLQVLALSTDLLGQQIGSEEEARTVAKKLNLPFPLLWADDPFIAGLEATQRVLLSEQTPLPLPSSFLVDARGRVAVLYRGPLLVAQLLEDVKLLDQHGSALKAVATPFAGKRLGWPAPIDPIQIALKLYEGGPSARVRRYLGQLIEIAETKGPGHEAMKPAELHYFMGTLLEEANQARRSIAAYRFALGHDPKHAQAHRNLARQLLRQGQVDPALEHYQRALASQPNDVALHSELVLALYRERRTAPAIQGLRQWLQHRPQDGRALRLLSWILATANEAEFRDGEEALRLAQAAARLSPKGDPVAADVLAAALAEAGRFDEALQVIDQVMASAAQSRLAPMKQRRAAYAKKQAWHEQ